MFPPDPAHPCVHSSLHFLSHGRPVYVATPYGQWAARGCAGDAYHAAVHWQTFIAASGYTGVSPIVMGHPMTGLEAWGHDDWMNWCFPLLDVCGSVFIPNVAGRWDSRGIAAEVERALMYSKPVVVWD